MGLTIRQASIDDARAVAELAAKVYGAEADELEGEFKQSLLSIDHAVFLAESDEIAIGFAEISIRNDYVNGCDSSPVAFLEGIFVEEGWRRRGVAQRLVDRCAEWACAKGCGEFASDRELDNETSAEFHLGCGFEETERVVYYRKTVASQGIERYDEKFWASLDRLVAEQKIVVDRPKGSAHPRYPSLIYPLDYGYLADTSSMDGDGIDMWLGSLGDKRLDAIIVTVDLFKKDSEIKLLLGCTAEEKQTILNMLNERMMSAILIERV